MNITNSTNINNKSTSFGLNIQTHLRGTEKALSAIPNISKTDARYVARCSELPDFKKMNMLGWRNNGHFFYPNSKNKSFGYKANTKNNALNFFMNELEKIKLSKEKYERLLHVGCLIHFIQDAQTPVHTEVGGSLKKLFDYKKHKEFERGKKYGMTSRLGILEQNFEEIKVNFTSFADLFKQTALDSQSLKVKYTNKNKWLEIQQHCYNRAVAVTKTLVKKLIEIYPDLFE